MGSPPALVANHCRQRLSTEGVVLVCARALANHFGDAEEGVLRALWPHLKRAQSIETALTVGQRTGDASLQSLLDRRGEGRRPVRCP
jgi:hypothetical protein